MIETFTLFAVLLQGWFLFRRDATIREKLVALLGVVAILSTSYIEHLWGFRVGVVLWLTVVVSQMDSSIPKAFKFFNMTFFIIVGSVLTNKKGLGWG